jgi:hypothetical protein
MPRETSPAEALIIDYLHRAGEGVGEKQAVIDYMTLVVGYDADTVASAMQDLANDGLLSCQRGGGGRSSLYGVVYDDDPGEWY